MPPIPHSVAALLSAYAAPLLALAVAITGSLLCGAKTRGAWLPANAALAALAGWALLLPASSLVRAGLAPRARPEALLAPAAACVIGAALVAWRGGKLGRWMPVLLAVFAGWWLARASAGRTEFWRVWVAVALLAAALSRAIAGQPVRGLACALALWGGLVLAGTAPVWIAAALVAVFVWVGLLLSRSGAALPSAVMAALIGGADLAGGRLVRGRLDATDLACLLAVAAPLIAGAAEARIGKRWGRAGPVLASVAGAAVAVALTWLVRRAVFT
jgi:hypothetical protein